MARLRLTMVRTMGKGDRVSGEHYAHTEALCHLVGAQLQTVRVYPNLSATAFLWKVATPSLTHTSCNPELPNSHQSCAADALIGFHSLLCHSSNASLYFPRMGHCPWWLLCVHMCVYCMRGMQSHVSVWMHISVCAHGCPDLTLSTLLPEDMVSCCPCGRLAFSKSQ